MAGEPKNQREIIARFERLREEVQNLSDTLSERRANAQAGLCKVSVDKLHPCAPAHCTRMQEHGLVLKTLQPLDKQRKCFRQIGDILVERTVGDVLPDVQTNKEQLDQVRSGERAHKGAVCAIACTQAPDGPAAAAGGALTAAAREEAEGAA